MTLLQQAARDNSSRKYADYVCESEAASRAITLRGLMRLRTAADDDGYNSEVGTVRNFHNLITRKRKRLQSFCRASHV